MKTNYAYKMTVIYGDIKSAKPTHIETLPFAKLILYGQNVAVLKETAYNLFTTYCKASNKPKGQYWVELYIEKLNLSDDDDFWDFYQKDHKVLDYEYFDSDEGEIEYSEDEKKIPHTLLNLPPSVTKAMEQIALHYDFGAQTDQLSEEVGELLVVLNKIKRLNGHGHPLREPLYAGDLFREALSEIADVMVVCYEVASLLNIGEEFNNHLKEIICAKVERTLGVAVDKTGDVVLKEALDTMEKEVGELQ